MATIPTTEPAAARAGDTWQWARAIADYPAPDWTLTYTLWSASAVLAITATQSGTAHAVSVAPTVTATYSAGPYEWVARVSDGTDVHTIATGRLTILPAVGTAMDTRSHARRMLDAINAMLEGRATGGDLDVIKTSIGDRATETDLPTLLTMRRQYAAAVQAEDDALAAARGERRGFVQMRF
jgi:hypothetical protein